MIQRYYLLGKPNSGKTLLFNRLTESEKKVANYSGATTVENKALIPGSQIELIDLPGFYSSEVFSDDEKLALSKASQTQNADTGFLYVIEALKLKSGLINALTLIKKLSIDINKVQFVFNMIDELELNKINLPQNEIESILKRPCHFVSALTKKNLTELKMNLLSLDTFPNLSIEDLESIQNNLSSLKLTPTSSFALKNSTRLDRYLLSPLWGSVFFIFIMSALFQSIFSWSSPFMDAIEWSLSGISQGVAGVLGEGFWANFFIDGIITGFGAFVIFTPQIFILTFIIKCLEASGYLARATIICHKSLRFFGLSGESFIPLLSSHACAIPGILAAKSIKSKKEKWITMLCLPLTVCSARLPVYALLIYMFIPPIYYLGGLFGSQGLAFLSLYLFGITLTLIGSFLLSRTLIPNKGQDPFILELPSYRWPEFFNIAKTSFKVCIQFIKDAGPMIFFANLGLWFLAQFPLSQTQFSESYLARMGRWLTPLMEPLGLAWEHGVALLTSFLARETFVSTLSTIYSSKNDDPMALKELLIQSQSLTWASGLALIVFFAIALQCVSTLAILKKELPKKFSVTMIFIVYLFAAYTLAWMTYQIFS